MNKTPSSARHLGLRGLAATALLALGLAAAQAQTTATPQTTVIQVNGMVCAFCAQGIEKRLTAMPAVGPVYINLEQKLVALAPKAGQSLDIDKVKKEIIEAGYDVNKVEASPKTVAEIRSAMRAAAKK